MRGRKLGRVCCTCEVWVFKIFVHLWYDVQYSTILDIILPNDNTAFLSDCDEVYIGLSVWIYNNLVDAFITKLNSTTLANNARVRIEYDQGLLIWDWARDKESATLAKGHALDTVTIERDLVEELVLLHVDQVDHCET